MCRPRRRWGDGWSVTGGRDRRYQCGGGLECECLGCMTDADQPAQPVSKPSSVFVEDFSKEAAYSLQCLHMMGGNEQASMAVTNEWLVI